MPQPNKAIGFVKKHKKKFIIGGSIYLALMVVVIVGAIILLSGDDSSDSSYDYTPPKDQYPRVEVKGMTVKEACEALKENHLLLMKPGIMM